METDKYSGDTAKLTKNVAYHGGYRKNIHTSTTGRGDYAKEVSYTKVGDTDEKLQDADGKVYTKRADGKYYADGEPDDSKNGITINHLKGRLHPRERRLQMRRQPTQPIQLSQMVYQRLI